MATETEPVSRGAQTEVFAREWIPRREVTEDTGKFRVSFMNWNVLADGLNGLQGPKSKKFAYVSEEYLALPYRVPLFLAEIRNWNCDIVCFQEFDLYKDQEKFMATMQGEDFNYVLASRQSKLWSPCLTIDPNLDPDGVAIFVKRDKFIVGEDYTTNQVQHKRWIEGAIRKNDDAVVDGRIAMAKIVELMGDDGPKIRQLLLSEMTSGALVDASWPGANETFAIESIQQWLNTPKPPVSCGVRLTPTARPDLSLYVLTTHLVASKKKKGEQQRYSELQDLLLDPGHVQRMENTETFLCFDMNASFEAMYDYAPMAYPFLTGSVPQNARVLENEEKLPPSEGKFLSATRDYANGDAEIPWSSWKKRKEADGALVDLKYGVDFVFYPKNDKWRVTKVSGLPNEAEMIECVRQDQAEKNLEDEPTPLPSRRYPSDHIAVCVELQYEAS